MLAGLLALLSPVHIWQVARSAMDVGCMVETLLHTCWEIFITICMFILFFDTERKNLNIASGANTIYVYFSPVFLAHNINYSKDVTTL